MRRPSQALPEGCPKKVMPLGDWITLNAADIPPVSEFESPKLYTAGNRQFPEPPPPPAAAPINPIGHPEKPRKRSTKTRRSFSGFMILQHSKAKVIRGSFCSAQIFSGFVPILGNGKRKRSERKWAESGIWAKGYDKSVRQKRGWNLSIVLCRLCRWRRSALAVAILILYEKSLDFCEDVNLFSTWQWQELIIIDHGGQIDFPKKMLANPCPALHTTILERGTSNNYSQQNTLN